MYAAACYVLRGRDAACPKDLIEIEVGAISIESLNMIKQVSPQVELVAGFEQVRRLHDTHDQRGITIA